MLTGITLEQAKERAPRWLWRKMEHSIDLLRKAEKLALIYDPDDGFYLAFSSGKDSQALYHMAELAGVKFKGHINWTSVDPPQVIRFKRKYYPEVVEHKPKKSIYALAVERGILPSMRIRWCCADLKESAGAGKVTLIGIRKEESVRRSKRHEVEVSNKAFSGNLEEFGEWQKEQIAKKEAKLIRKMKREGKKVNEDEFSLKKDNEVRCINGKDSILISPIFEWTEKDVWTFLNDVVRVPHCELYDQGYKRIGCILCPMSPHRQKMRELQDFPHVKRNWIKAIKAIREGGGIRERVYMVESASQRNNSQCQRNAQKLGTELPPPHDRRGLWKHKELSRHPSSRDWDERVLRYNKSRMPEFRQKNVTDYETLEQKMQQRYMVGFSDGPSANGIVGGQNEPTEDEIAEKIFDWWISQKSYSKWYADKYLQLKLPLIFDEEDGDMETDT